MNTNDPRRVVRTSGNGHIIPGSMYRTDAGRLDIEAEARRRIAVAAAQNKAAQPSTRDEHSDEADDEHPAQALQRRTENAFESRAPAEPAGITPEAFARSRDFSGMKPQPKGPPYDDADEGEDPREADPMAALQRRTELAFERNRGGR